MNPDSELLRAYVEQGSEAAFAEIVARHLDLVYSAAIRRVGGNTHLAQDAAQLAFADLARRASSLTRHTNLAGWLYTSACYAALKLVRAEARRAAREQAALLMDETTADPPAEWERLRPLLDSAMLQLNAGEREAVILRFFTGRSFAEIGAVQALGEDTARKRVTRALDKLHGLLARRGFTSTSAALAAVLTQQAITAAPAGLAQSVSGLALASAATSTTSTLGGTFFTFMSITKLPSLGGLAATFLLCLSLCLTAFLIVDRSGESPQSASISLPAPRIAAQQEAAPAAPVTMTEFTRSLVSDGNLALLRDELRTAGASDTRIREVLLGILRRRYRSDLSAKRIGRIEHAWWRDDLRTYGITPTAPYLRDEPGTQNEAVDGPMAELMGPDPGIVRFTEMRYDFLPPAMRMTFLQLERDTQLSWVTTGDPEVDARLDAEHAQKAEHARTERARLLATLTPAQRDEYELRFGTSGTRLAAQLRIVPGGTEEEFRQVYRLAKDYAGTVADAAPVASRGMVLVAGPQQLGAETAVFPVSPDPSTVDRFVAALGYDRALDYLWIGATEYTAVARMAADGSIPATAAGQFAQLAAETGNKAAAIHQDPSLTPGQRQAALRDLQATVRPEVDALLPAAAQQNLPPSALAWFEQLAQGKYKMLAPTLPGAVRIGPSSVMNSVTSATSTPTLVSLPRRPANR